MKPTKVIIEHVRGKHIEYVSNFIIGKATATFEEVLDDHNCALGTLLSSLPGEERCKPVVAKIVDQHRRFHYTCAVVAYLDLNRIDYDSFTLMNHVRADSEKLVRLLDEWKEFVDV